MEVTIKCDRCGNIVNGVEVIGIGSGGFYRLRSKFTDSSPWKEFARGDEEVICDHCMWEDPKYIALYGVHK